MTGIAAPITTALPIFHNGEDCSSCRKRNVNQIAINEIAIANTTRALHSAADLIDTPNPMVRGWAWSQFVRPSSTKSSASSIHGDAADLRLISRCLETARKWLGTSPDSGNQFEVWQTPGSI